jgi:hypothetical protein
MRPYQTKKACALPRSNQHSEETIYRMGENICQLFIWHKGNIQNI